MSIPDRIKQIRVSHELSQSRFADIIGASSGNVGDWERGRSLPGSNNIQSICEKFDVSADWLLFGKERKYQEPQDSLITLISGLPDNIKSNVEHYIRFLLWNLEEEKKKAAQYELPVIKETTYEYFEYLPLIGRAAAGKPVLIDEMVQGYIPVEADNHQFTNCYLIEAIGDSMIGDGIDNGDLVIFRPQPAVDNGDIALVRIESDLTIKKFYKDKDIIYLKSSNPKYEPMKFTVADNITIIGKVVKTLKKDVLNKMVIPETGERLREYKAGVRVAKRGPVDKAFYLKP